jgi:hypothetical protein
MSMREIISGNIFPTIDVKHILKSQPITVKTTLLSFRATAAQIYNGVIYSDWEDAPGTITVLFPSMAEIDNYISNTNVGNSFTIELYVLQNARTSFNIILGENCTNIDGNDIIYTSILNNAPRYFKIIAVRQENSYIFYSPTY